MTPDGQALKGHQQPTYLSSVKVGGSLVSSAPSGFDTINGVKLVRPGLSDVPKTGKSPSQDVVEASPMSKIYQGATLSVT